MMNPSSISLLWAALDPDLWTAVILMAEITVKYGPVVIALPAVCRSTDNERKRKRAQGWQMRAATWKHLAHAGKVDIERGRTMPKTAQQRTDDTIRNWNDELMHVYEEAMNA